MSTQFAGLGNIPPPKYVPLKRGLWFRWNCERWHFSRDSGYFTFLAFSFSPGVFGIVILNFILHVFTIDPDGPPMAYDSSGKLMGQVFEPDQTGYRGDE